MERLRALAALLGCLAVLAGSVMTVATASARVAADIPCTQCDDCDSMPCHAPTAGCLNVCIGAAPALGVAAFLTSSPAAKECFGAAHPALLIGLSPPPDPFPPRLIFLTVT
jgi:hypothetical protein